MWIKIRAGKVRFSMPAPLSMVGGVIRMIPEAAFEDMRKKAPEEYAQLITKEMVQYYWNECKDALIDCKGLELIHVETHDGTFVSIRV